MNLYLFHHGSSEKILWNSWYYCEQKWLSWIQTISCWKILIHWNHPNWRFAQTRLTFLAWPKKVSKKGQGCLQNFLLMGHSGCGLACHIGGPAKGWIINNLSEHKRGLSYFDSDAYYLSERVEASMGLVFLFLFRLWKKKTRLVRQSSLKP